MIAYTMPFTVSMRLQYKVLFNTDAVIKYLWMTSSTLCVVMSCDPSK
jgi:hypothetical protein